MANEHNMSEKAQSQRALNLQKQVEKTHEKVDACLAKIADPSTPQWERDELTKTLGDMAMKLDRLTQRQSTLEPPDQPAPTGEEQLKAQESSVANPSSGPKDKDKDKGQPVSGTFQAQVDKDKDKK